jgi:IgA Peptidase M64
MVLLEFAIPLVLAALPSQQREVEPDDEAGHALAHAEEQARDGHYEEARREYERIAKHFSGTDAGTTAARRSKPSAFLGWRDLIRTGPSSNRVDVIILGEGYQLGEQDQFDDLADEAVSLFEKQPSLREYLPYLNFIRVNLVSAENGVDGFGRDYDTALGARTLSTEVGHVGIDPAAVQAMLSELPAHDGFAIVFAKLGVAGTATGRFATLGGQSMPALIHEWGHAFAGLGDEYATHTHERGPAMRGINVATSDDPASAPWAHWLDARVPGIGLYEGAAGQVRDAWRPTASGCVMESGEFFCRVCQEAMVLAIYSLVDPIEECRPPAPESGAGLMLGDDELVLEVRVMQPKSHALQVQWWVQPSASVTSAPAAGPGSRAPGLRNRGETRQQRGPLPALEGKPWDETNADNDGVHHLRLRAGQLEPGLYRVTCRVRDTTQWAGERFPWVLRDPQGLLESERAWWLMVMAPR